MNTTLKWFPTFLCVLALTLWLSSTGCSPAQEDQGDTQQEGEEHDEGDEHGDHGDSHEEGEEHSHDQPEGEHHAGGRDAEIIIPEHADEIVAEILAQDLLIQDHIETGMLAKIHVPAFAARDLVQALAEKAEGLSEADKQTLNIATKRIVPGAKELDKSGDANDAAKTKVAYRGFEKAIQSIKGLYPDAVPSHYWTCSMPQDADVWKAAAGKCPKCGMKLIEKGSASHEHSEAEHHDAH